MIDRLYHRSKILMLLAFKPVIFFERINQLEWYKHTLQMWFESYAFESKSKILDIGCATGVLAQHISKAGYQVEGVDLSEGMIEIAKRNNPTIPYHVADVKKLPFKNEVFDVVLSASLINIVEDKNSALKEMVRVCKQGGTISVLVPLKGFESTELSALQQTLGISGFSLEALKTWNKRPPKMTINTLNALFITMGLNVQKPKKYLNGMVFSLSAVKGEKKTTVKAPNVNA